MRCIVWKVKLSENETWIFLGMNDSVVSGWGANRTMRDPNERFSCILRDPFVQCSSVIVGNWKMKEKGMTEVCKEKND
jgi:hypothetical protein